MKYILILATLFLASLSYGQKKEYDPKMIGCYRGSEQNQQIDGLAKYWVSCRLDNGKSILLFVVIDEDGHVTQTTENGRWWTNNGKYYELHNVSHIVDVYEYKILKNGDVKFKSIEILGNKDNTYEFTDFKIDED